MSDDDNERGETPVPEIRTLVGQCLEALQAEVSLSSEGNDIGREANETAGRLLSFTSTTSRHTEEQTAMAQERTALTREQTRLTTRSTELANIRTDLARERSSLAGQRTDLSVVRTDMARRRTSLSEDRTELARARTDLSRQRTLRAVTRTRLSRQRNDLALQRTELALIRTGLALFTLGVALVRYFGPSWWSLFDVGLLLAGVAFAAGGLVGYLRARARIRRMDALLGADEGLLDVLPA